jgi:hypothetical protein
VFEWSTAPTDVVELKVIAIFFLLLLLMLDFFPLV